MKEEKDKTAAKYSAPAAARLLDIIELMVHNNRKFTLTEIAQETGISLNSVFRIMIELEHSRYVIKHESDNTYELTGKLYYLGASLESRVSLVSEARRAVSAIRRETQETVLLTKLDENSRTLILDQAPSPQPIRFLSTVGLSYDSYCSAMGKCLLAFSSRETIDEYIESTEFRKITDTTITDPDQFRSELERIRETGVAYDDEESCVGLTCIACPILSNGGTLVGSIGVSALSFRVTPDVLGTYVEAVKKYCLELSMQLGYLPE